MQGDRLGRYTEGDREIGFGLVKTQNGTNEIFIEIMKDDGKPVPDESELLHRLCNRLKSVFADKIQVLT
jgi:hypothetical protein